MMTRFNIFLIVFAAALVSFFWFFAEPTFATTTGSSTPEVEYTLLEPGIPYITSDGAGTKVTASSFLKGIIQLGIALAGLLAVLMLIIGGIQYMTQDGLNQISKAKETIKNALMGFLLIIAAWTILYTINPSLTNLEFELKKFEPKAPPAPISTPTPTNGESGCTNCIAVPASIPHKDAARNGCAKPGPCVIHRDFIPKLQTLTEALRGKVTWEVTEMYPPTVRHLDKCHNNGTCVDAALRAVTTDRLITFLTAVEGVFGTNYTYEVCGQRLRTLQNDVRLSKFKARFSCPSTTTGESIHIEI